MKAIIIATVAALSTLSIQLHADEAAWNKLINNAVQNGHRAVVSAGYEYRTLTRATSDDETKPRTMNYFSTVGGKDSQGVYQIGNESLVSETWTIDAQGNWNIDQYIFVTTSETEAYQYAHNVVTEKQDG